MDFTERIKRGFKSITQPDETPVTVSQTVSTPLGEYVNYNDTVRLLSAMDQYTAADLYRTQPNLRAAIDLLANNVGQLPLHVYKLDGKEGRDRDRDSVLSKILKDPSPEHTQTEIIRALVADLALYDQAWLALVPVKKTTHHTGYVLLPIAIDSIVKIEGSFLDNSLVLHIGNGTNAPKQIEGRHLINLHGWSPEYSRTGISRVETLKATLQEQIAATAYRLSVWKNGGMVSSFFTRPAGTPWTKEERDRFVQQQKSYKAKGSLYGGTPVLEDGMELKTNRISAKEEQWAEAQELAMETVCRVYHINPTSLGSNKGVSYGNLKDQKRSFYSETLGPIITQVEQKLNTRLINMLQADGHDLEGYFVEFNMKEKLRGDFAEEIDIINKSVGGLPWMTVNEVRKLQNLKPIEGGNELMVPLNFAQQALEAPEDVIEIIEEPKAIRTGSSDYKAAKRRVGATPEGTERTRKMVEDLFLETAKRQKRVVLAKLGSKSTQEWWDEERWNKELADDMYVVALAVTRIIGSKEAAALGFSGAYDPEVTEKFLREVAESRAGAINAATRDAIAEALKPDSEITPERVFDDLAESRGELASQTFHNTLVTFAGVEAAKHVARKATPEGDPPAPSTKTWIVTSNNPRDSHSSMNGETVNIDDKFSNGANWPGDPVLGADGVANCKCGVEVSVEI